MKTKDLIIAVVFFLAVGYVSSQMNFDAESPVFMIFALVPISLFGFNFIVRKNYNFKPYFTSKFNVLTSKYNAAVSSELPKELMFEKMIEVLNSSELNVVYTDPDNHQILATKGMTWKSWGENLYIDFAENEGRTQMNFTSTTVVGIVSWGTNEKNYHNLLFNYEESLTI